MITKTSGFDQECSHKCYAVMQAFATVRGRSITYACGRAHLVARGKCSSAGCACPQLKAKGSCSPSAYICLEVYSAPILVCKAQILALSCVGESALEGDVLLQSP